MQIQHLGKCSEDGGPERVSTVISISLYGNPRAVLTEIFKMPLRGRLLLRRLQRQHRRRREQCMIIYMFCV